MFAKLVSLFLLVYSNLSSYPIALGVSGGPMVIKLDKQTITDKFESHWVPYTYGLDK